MSLGHVGHRPKIVVKDLNRYGESDFCATNSSTNRAVVIKRGWFQLQKLKNVTVTQNGVTFHDNDGTFNTIYFPSFVYFVTGILHFSLGIAIASIDFVWPITVFETVLANDVQSSFNCVYDYAVINNDTFCSKTQPGIPPMSCIPALLEYQRNSANLSFTTSGPWLQAYELQQIVTDTDGATLAKNVLLSVAFITSVSDFIKAIQVHKKINDPDSDFKGLPILWREYAITTALLALFISSLAQVFELTAIVGATLSQFALMYLGYVIDYMAGLGYCDLSLVLFWQPGMALFAISWYPVFHSIIKLYPVLCTSGNSFTCTKSCFENDYNFSGAVLGSFIIYLGFPLVALYKVFQYQKIGEKWLGEYYKYYTLNILAFFGFVPYSFFKSIYVSVLDSATPEPVQKDATVSQETKLKTFIYSQISYALLSISSKAFIVIFFLYMFATDFPWRDIQRAFS